MAYMNILPDPDRKILPSGKQNDSTGTAGPGFASVKFTSNQPTMMSRTNGGRVVTRSQAKQHWSLDISYNPLTRAEFEPVNTFLLSRQGRLNPFFVVLPQYDDTQDSTFSTYIGSNTISVDGSANSGATDMKIDGLSGSSGSPKPGDMFTITDPENSNHVKAYMVTRVETNSDFDTTQPAADERIIHFNPSLIYFVPDNATINFSSPKIRVIPRNDVQEYSLGTNNLYQFNLSLEEALP